MNPKDFTLFGQRCVFQKFTFSLLSPLLGVHVGKNPISGQRFMHVAYLPFCGIDYHIYPERTGDARR